MLNSGYPLGRPSAFGKDDLNASKVSYGGLGMNTNNEAGYPMRNESQAADLMPEIDPNLLSPPAT